MSLDDDFYNLDPSEWANLILPNIVNVTTDCQDSLTKYRHRNEYNECGDPNVIVDQLLPKNCSHPRQCLQDPKTRLQTQKLIQNTEINEHNTDRNFFGGLDQYQFFVLLWRPNYGLE